MSLDLDPACRIREELKIGCSISAAVRVPSMVSLNEELAVAQAAKKALQKLSGNGSTIRHAIDVASHAVPSDWRLNDAHRMVVDALSNLLNASEDVLAERIEEAKAAVEEWIYCLETD